MKTILATIAGLITGGVIIWALEILMLNIPVKSLVVTVIAHIVGVFTGMCVAFVIEKEILFSLYIVGGLFLMITALRLTMISHPTWFNVADLGGVLLTSLLFLRSVKKN